MLEKFYTLEKDGIAEQIIQKSRFIGYAKKTETEEEARQFIQQIKKKHYDATHNCSAYLIGQNDQIQKANDDGEPGGTAGMPILDVIKKKELKNVTVVITRYFGGIKLGGGGLIRAYSSSASLVLEAAGIVKMQMMQIYQVTADYSLLGFLQNALEQSVYQLHKIDYSDYVVLEILVNAGQESTFETWITDTTNNRITIKAIKREYRAKKIV